MAKVACGGLLEGGLRRDLILTLKRSGLGTYPGDALRMLLALYLLSKIHVPEVGQLGSSTQATPSIFLLINICFFYVYFILN